MKGEDLVTVVIPAMDEEAFLGACLDSVLGQDHGALQVVVVDGGSRDDTVSIVKAHMANDGRVELLYNSRRNISSSLNLALADARGRWLVRVDAHSTIPPDYVRIALDRLREGHWGGVGGRKDGVGTSAAGRAIAAAMGSRFGVGNSTYHYGTSAQEVDHLPFGAYPVELARRLNGWDEQVMANEDFEFDYRIRCAGERLLFDPRIAIQWQCRQSIPDLYRQYHRYGAGKADVALLHPDSMRVRHAAPPAFVAYLAFGSLLGVRRPTWLLAMLAPYAAALTVASAKTGRKLGAFSDRLLVPVAFATMHVAWGIGFWAGLRRRLARIGRRGTSTPEDN